MKYAIFLLMIFLFLISVPEVFAGVGIGMGPTKFTLATSIGRPYSVTAIVYNPGDYDIKARVTFDCEGCEHEAYFLGWHVGKVVEDYKQFFSFEPEEVYVPNGTTPETAIPMTVRITPNFLVRKTLVITTPESINFLVRGINPDYKGEFGIPYYTLLIGDKTIKGAVTVSAFWSTFGTMGATPAVGADLEMNIKGVPLGSIIIIILAVLAVITFIVWKIGPKKVLASFPKLRKKESK